MNDEGLLANGVSATKRGETIAGRSCFGKDGGEKNDGVKGKTDERLLVIGVSATGENEMKRGVAGVSATETVRKWRRWEEMKNAE
jgi:hypothetical protein